MSNYYDTHFALLFHKTASSSLYKSPKYKLVVVELFLRYDIYETINSTNYYLKQHGVSNTENSLLSLRNTVNSINVM